MTSELKILIRLKGEAEETELFPPISDGLFIIQNAHEPCASVLMNINVQKGGFAVSDTDSCQVSSTKRDLVCGSIYLHVMQIGVSFPACELTSCFSRVWIMHRQTTHIGYMMVGL